MANRYADNIRRIAGVKEINRGLGNADERAPIISKKGVGYLAPTVGAGAKGSVAQGTTLDPTATASLPTNNLPGSQPYASNLQQRLSNGNAKAFDPGNPESWAHGEDVGVYDIGSLIDGTVGPGIADPATGEFADVITGLSGLRDCADTTDLKVYNNDNFPTPSGWDDDESPPAGDDTSWQSGYYWLSVWGLATNQPTVAAAAQEIADGLGGSVQSIDDVGFAPTQYTATILKPDTSTQGFAINRFACPSSPDICVGTAPSWPSGYTTTGGDFPYTSSSNWPDDSTMSIKYKDGKFSISKYEGNLGVGFIPGSDYGAIRFSFDSGARYGKLEPGANGGLLIYETDTCGGTPTGTVTVTHESGAVAGYTSTDQLTHLRPKA